MSVALAAPNESAFAKLRLGDLIRLIFSSESRDNTAFQTEQMVLFLNVLFSEFDSVCDEVVEKEGPASLFDMLCVAVRGCISVAREQTALGDMGTILRRANVPTLFIDRTRLMLVEYPEFVDRVPADLEDVLLTVRISPLAYLRSMWSLFWSAIRHPLSNTTIDLSTGRVLYRT